MRLPWVARLAYQQAVERYIRAELQVDRLQDAIVRMRRRERQMPEVPHEPRKAAEQMPAALIKYLEAIEDKGIRRENKMQMLREYATLGSWDPIIATVYAPAPEEEG